jgi:hypothetical protein
VGIKRAVAPGSRATWKVNKAKMTRTATSTAYERWKSIFRHSVCAKHDSYGRVEGVTSRRKAHSSMVSTLLICKRPRNRNSSPIISSHGPLLLAESGPAYIILRVDPSCGARIPSRTAPLPIDSQATIFIQRPGT